MDHSNIDNTLVKSLENTCNRSVRGLQLGTYWTRSFISYDFFYTLRTPVRACYSFFPKIHLAVSLFLQKIRLPALVSYKVELRVYLNIPNVSLKFSQVFQNIEAAFEVFHKRSCSAKCCDEI